jgi:Ca2+-binding EF-hand superfamily protein
MQSGKPRADPSKSQWPAGELSKILAEIHPLFEQKISIAYKNVRVAWLKIDEDSSGTLDHEEFMALFSKFNLILRPDQRRRLFELFDPKQTGQVTYERFNLVVGQVTSLHCRTFVLHSSCLALDSSRPLFLQ